MEHIVTARLHVNEETEQLVKAQALRRLAQELEAGKNSGELVDEAQVYWMLGVTPE
jgi:DNA-damage-inducible protein J